jgi:NAD(P)-dependent dehydrogenase (short-subunit alcohol dehydrogenase family)
MIKEKSIRNIFITGANRGMGLGYVRFYLGKGILVVATAKNPTECHELNSLHKKYPAQLQILELNVASEKSIDELKKWLHKKNHSFSIVINNAGISVEEEFGNWTMVNFEQHFRVNTIGPALISQVITPFLQKGGKLIQISSGLGSLALNINPQMPLDAYAMSKCAMHSLTIRLAEKLREKNIIVTAINPGWVKTDMGGNEAPMPVNVVIQNITNTIENLTEKETGSFLTDLGEQIPW